MSVWFISGAAIAILLIIGAGVYSGRRVRTAQDFDTGGGAGMSLTVGAIVTSLIGGNSTIGTAQLAYVYGLSAWWYTLGSAIGCVMLAFLTSDRLRHSGETTLGGIIGNAFGGNIRTLTSLCVASGSVLNLVTQLLSGAAIMATLIPGSSSILRLCLAALLVLLYIIFGGARSTGAVGIVKLALLFPALLLCGGLAFSASGGAAGLSVLPKESYFTPFARGFGTDFGAGLALAFGVLSSQAYATTLLGARDDRTARRSLLISAAIAPILGLCGILVGLNMRLHAPAGIIGDTAAMTAAAKTAFPDFVRSHCPPFICGLILASLLIAAAGSSAGLILGLSTIMHRDIVDRITDRYKDPVRGLHFSRVCLFMMLLLGVGLALIPTSFIIDLGFLSSGLRAATVFSPLLAALFLPGRVTVKTVFCSVIAGLASILAAQLFSLNINPSLFGIFAGAAVMAAGVLLSRPRTGRAL